MKGALFSLVFAFSLVSNVSAQWTRVTDVPAVDIYNVWTNGDTIAAASDRTVFVSVDAGSTWIMTADVASGVTMVEAVRVHNGRLYAGTYGQGMFVSGDLGATWQSFNQGLVGGFNNSQLYIMDFFLRADTLYAATGGAGPWIRDLAIARVCRVQRGRVLPRLRAAGLDGVVAFQ